MFTDKFSKSFLLRFVRPAVIVLRVLAVVLFVALDNMGVVLLLVAVDDTDAAGTSAGGNSTRRRSRVYADITLAYRVLKISIHNSRP